MVCVEISRRAAESLLQGSRETFPDEFIALLTGVVEARGGGGVGGARLGAGGGGVVRVSGVLLAPFSEYGPDSSSFSPLHIPANSGVVGSFHSHPGPNESRPSKQDLLFFSQHGRVHFIASLPYSLKTLACFDASGKRVAFRIT